MSIKYKFLGTAGTLLLAVVLMTVYSCQENGGPLEKPAPEDPVVLLLHGGAGGLTRTALDAASEARYRQGLQAALDTGYAVLQGGGSALDAVCAAITLMEDHPSFNAGRGAVLTAQGKAELDASLMNGRDRQAGAVTGIIRTRHPILLAREVMQHSPHVFFSGPGAEEFARERGLEEVDPEWFLVGSKLASTQNLADKKYGTVGALARDRSGDLAAGTSTGGMSNKKHGRIGDSPIIGAGTWAWNATCAVSCTGTGENFIRTATAHTVSDLMLYAGLSVQEAADSAMALTAATGGQGGIIALDSAGRMGISYNTPMMFRAWITRSGKTGIAIFNAE